MCLDQRGRGSDGIELSAMIPTEIIAHHNTLAPLDAQNFRNRVAQERNDAFSPDPSHKFYGSAVRLPYEEDERLGIYLLDEELRNTHVVGYHSTLGLRVEHIQEEGFNFSEY